MPINIGFWHWRSLLLQQGDEHFAKHFRVCGAARGFHSLAYEKLQGSCFSALVILRHLPVGGDNVFCDNLEVFFVALLEQSQVRGELFRFPAFLMSPKRSDVL